MKEFSNITIYIAIGSLFISCLSFLNSIRQSSYTKRVEKLKTYDKIYFDVCDMLLYEYKKIKDRPYYSDDKDLERAVNEFGKLHWIEQLYGRSHYDYKEFDNDMDRTEFNNKVQKAHSEHQQKILDYPPVNQSPVFHLQDENFKYKFLRVMEHLKSNISYFNPKIRKEWEKIYFRTTENVKDDYESLARANMMACEEIEESVDDPYLNIFYEIRKEHRLLNRTKREFFGDLFFNIKCSALRLYYIRKYKNRF